MAANDTIRRPGARLSLTPTQRKGTLILHVVASSTWLGIDILTAILVGIGLLGRDSGRSTTVYQALGSYFLVPTLIAALVAGLVSLASGILLGAGTKWGLLRYWWVAVKLVLNIVLCVAVAIILLPVDQIAVGQREPTDVTPLFTLALIAAALLVFADTLSIFKPWRRVRRAPGRLPVRVATPAEN